MDSARLKNIDIVQPVQAHDHKLSMALSKSPIHIVVAHVDLDLRYTYIHNPHPDFDPKNVIGLRDDEVVKNDGTLRLLQIKKQVITTGRGISETIAFPLSEGQLFYQVTVEPLCDNVGSVIGASSVSVDITNLKKTEEELTHLYKKMEEMSFSDGLTGVANRRMLDQTLEREWQHALRYSKPLTLILIDIDYFKQYNDLYGHLKGDDCLRHIAKALSHVSKRAVDLVGRYGGEEFFLLLPDTNEKQAIDITKQCLEAIKRLNICHDSSEIADHVTISAGVKTIIPSKDRQPSELLEATDQLLYRAKNNGRNRLEFDS